MKFGSAIWILLCAYNLAGQMTCKIAGLGNVLPYHQFTYGSRNCALEKQYGKIGPGNITVQVEYVRMPIGEKSSADDRFTPEKVEVPLSAQHITLECNYNVDPSNHPHYIKWERLDQEDILVLQKDRSGRVAFGQGYRDKVRIGDGCSLIISSVTQDLAGVYTVTIFNATDISSDIMLQVTHCKVLIPESTSKLTVYIPTPYVTLPCNILTKTTNVTIEWIRWDDQELIVRKYNDITTVGPKYKGRVTLEQGCSLKIINPTETDTGDYRVSVSYDVCPDLRAEVDLGFEDWLCLTYKVVMAVFVAASIVFSGIIVTWCVCRHCRCCRARNGKNSSTEENRPNQNRPHTSSGPATRAGGGPIIPVLDTSFTAPPPIDSSENRRFQLMLLYLSNNLKPGDLRKMKLFLKAEVGQRRVDECQTAEDIFSAMQEHGLLSAGNLNSLLRILEDIKRNDLLDYVKRWKEQQS